MIEIIQLADTRIEELIGKVPRSILDKYSRCKITQSNNRGYSFPLITVVFHFYAVFWVTRFLKTGIKLENFRVSSDDNAKKPYFALGEILKSSAMLFRSFSTSRRSKFRSFFLDLEYCGD